VAALAGGVLVVHFTNRKNAPLLFSTRLGTRPMFEGSRVPPENVANDVCVEDEARQSGVGEAQPHAGATQESVEVVPPPLPVITRLGREAH
jgi:hypothetical protein